MTPQNDKPLKIGDWIDGSATEPGSIFAGLTADGKPLKIGDIMPDGSILAGFTTDRKQQIYAMPNDLGVTMTFNDAVKAVKKLNEEKALGHDDWQIPSLDDLKFLQNNQKRGHLKGIFKTAASKDGSDFPNGFYWSSTEGPENTVVIHDLRTAPGAYNELCGYKDRDRLSCLPVRLVPALKQDTPPPSPPKTNPSGPLGF